MTSYSLLEPQLCSSFRADSIKWGRGVGKVKLIILWLRVWHLGLVRWLSRWRHFSLGLTPCPEFHSDIPHGGRKEPTPSVVLWPPHACHVMCVHMHTWTLTHEINERKNESSCKTYFSVGQHPSLERVGFHDSRVLLHLSLKAPLLKNITLGFKLEQASCGMQAHLPYFLSLLLCKQ